MLTRPFFLLLLMAPLELFAQSVDTLQAVQTADSVIGIGRGAVAKTETILNLSGAASSQVADSLSFLQKVYQAESTVVDTVNSALSLPAHESTKLFDKGAKHTTDPYNNVASEANEGLSGVGINRQVEEVSLPGMGSQLEAGDMLPSTDALLKGVPASVNTGSLQKAQKVLGQSDQVLGQTKAIGGEIEAISKGNLTNTEKLSATAAQQLMKTEALQVMEKEAGAVGIPAGMREGAAPDPRALVEAELKKQIVQVAMSQFGQQTASIEPAQAQFSKLKAKYQEVQSLRNRQWVKKTALDHTTFRERIVPGLSFQVLDGNYLIIDFVPQLSFLINAKWQTGIEGIYRACIAKNNQPDRTRYNVSGTGLFSAYQVWKSFWIYGEGRRCYWQTRFAGNNIPPGILQEAQQLSLDYDLLLGIKKGHQFSRHVKGHAKVLYNLLYNADLPAYPGRWHLLFGFEWRFRAQDP